MRTKLPISYRTHSSTWSRSASVEFTVTLKERAAWYRGNPTMVDDGASVSSVVEASTAAGAPSEFPATSRAMASNSQAPSFERVHAYGGLATVTRKVQVGAPAER